MTVQTTATSAAGVREQLQNLLVERALANVEGLTASALYMADLEDEIAATRTAYVGAAITEIATLRGELSGRLHG